MKFTSALIGASILAKAASAVEFKHTVPSWGNPQDFQKPNQLAPEFMRIYPKRRYTPAPPQPPVRSRP